MQEYIHAKSKHTIDFQFHLCKTPVNQYTKVKLRDKRYQHLHSNFASKLDVCDLFDLLNEQVDEPNQIEAEPENVENDSILKRAFLLSKSVPRLSNRAKWKESSGFAPNMLNEKELNGKRLCGDIVFCQSFDEKLVMLKVVTDTELNDKSKPVDAVLLNGEAQLQTTVNTEKLIKD